MARLFQAGARRHVAVSTHHLFDDARISWKAAGILTYMLTRPDGWEIRKGDLIERHSDGKDAVTSGLKELRDAGYIATIPVPGGGQDWLVSELPLSRAQWDAVRAERGRVSRHPENPSDGEPGRITSGEEYSPPLKGSPPQGKPNEELLPDGNEGRKRKRKTSLPAGWRPAKGERARALAEGLDVEAEAERFRSHHEARGSTFADWDAAFRTWLLNAVRFAKERTGVTRDPEAPTIGTVEWAEHEMRAAEARAYRE